MMKKIVITGPESSGKTTLAKNLSQALGVNFVQEFVREYAQGVNRSLDFGDLSHIAKGQVANELNVLSSGPDILVCDTDFLTIDIWAKLKFNRRVEEVIQSDYWKGVDLYLLCKPDMPWQPDHLREDPNNRDLIYNFYKERLIYLGVRFEEVGGPVHVRLSTALGLIDNI